jgi:hypothetical protein
MLIRWIILFLFVASSASAQTIPRTASGKPDLQGIWQIQNRAAFDLQSHVARAGHPAGMGVVEGEEIPYQAWALAQKQANFANRVELDPLNKCWLPGTPRIMYMDWPFHIFQNDEHVAMTFEWTQVWRLIYTNGEPPLYPGIESFMGHSRGQWEGDVLVVTVNDFNDRTWLDGAGNFHSAAMQLTERYRMLDADTIEYEVTIEDPEVFTRPWTIRMPLHRQKDVPRLLEYQCQAEVEEANGDFERDLRTWYPAEAHPDNLPFDANAVTALPAPEVSAELPRLADGTPNISGYFSADGGGANYGLEPATDRFLTPTSRGVVVDPPDSILPYQPWARVERIDREKPHRGYDDPTAHCFVAGVPRSHYVPSPFHILQVPGYVVVLHERMSWRQIPLDGRGHLPEHLRLWMGDSVGRWEGDTLVVESTNFNGKAWLNESGDVVSHAQTVVETFTPVSAGQIVYRATVTDPLVYTRPWTMEMPFIGAEDELLEVACLEDNNDLHHLKDVRDEYRAAQTQEN